MKIITGMATLTIKVNETTSAGKSFISFIKTLPFVTIEKAIAEDDADGKRKRLDEALQDIKKGKVFSANSTKEMFDQILG